VTVAHATVGYTKRTSSSTHSGASIRFGKSHLHTREETSLIRSQPVPISADQPHDQTLRPEWGVQQVAELPSLLIRRAKRQMHVVAHRLVGEDGGHLFVA
jgi:hypothetical protein